MRKRVEVLVGFDAATEEVIACEVVGGKVLIFIERNTELVDVSKYIKINISINNKLQHGPHRDLVN